MIIAFLSTLFSRTAFVVFRSVRRRIRVGQYPALNLSLWPPLAPVSGAPQDRSRKRKAGERQPDAPPDRCMQRFRFFPPAPHPEVGGIRSDHGAQPAISARPCAPARPPTAPSRAPRRRAHLRDSAVVRGRQPRATTASAARLRPRPPRSPRLRHPPRPAGGS